MKKHGKVLELFKSQEDQDIILNRLHAVNDILNEFDDEMLDLVQTKVLEAIDWYSRYCDEVGFEIRRNHK
jgi:hypothetical protein